MSSSRQGSPRRALFVVLLASLLAVVWILRPLAVALFMAGVLGVALWPAHQRLCRLLRGKPKIAAALLILGLLVLVITPLVALSVFVIRQGLEAADFISSTVAESGVEGLVERLPEALQSPARSALGRLDDGATADLGARLQSQLSGLAGSAAGALAAIVSTTGSVLFQWAMMLIALFFFVTNKEDLLEWLDDASPLGKDQTKELFREFRLVTGAVLRSTILTALVQSIAAVIGYYIVSLPSPVFFGALTFVVALIPAIGGSAVCLLAAALLFLAGHPISALFLAIWGLLVVGLVDNLVKPWLIQGDVQMHGAVVFFSLLGGLASVGAIGLLLGPLAVALFIALLRIYRRDYGPGSFDDEA
jgi:predicted PurR-regulated permease PerM